MPKKPKNSNLVLPSLKRCHLSNLRDIVRPALTTTFRRALEAIDPSYEDERLGMLRVFYHVTTMLLAEEARAYGVVDPLGELEDEIGMFNNGYPDLRSALGQGPPTASRRSR